jgi:hypothetical protein
MAPFFYLEKFLRGASEGANRVTFGPKRVTICTVLENNKFSSSVRFSKKSFCIFEYLKAIKRK